MSYGHLLRAARLESGLTQAEVARKVGISASVLSAYEHEAREPKVGVFLDLLRALGKQTLALSDSATAPTLDSHTVSSNDRLQARADALFDVLDLADKLPSRSRPQMLSPLRTGAR